jgi:GAF domain-containing protein
MAVTTDDQWAELLRAVSQPAAHAELDVLLQHAVQLGSGVAPAAVSCSITEIIGSEEYRTPVSSDQLALDLDRAQYQAGDGPCMAAARERERQYFDATTDGTRFPGFTEAALERGVRSSISLPLTSGHRSAALNFYACSRYAFDAERPRAVADLLARCISVLMTSSQTDSPTVGSAEGPEPVAGPQTPNVKLRAARERAQLIGNAETVLIAQRSLSRRDALSVLIRRSRAENRSIFQVAHAVVSAAGTEQSL